MTVAQLISLFIVIVGFISATASMLAIYKFWERRTTPGIPYLILKMVSNAVFNFATSVLITINLATSIITGTRANSTELEGVIFITAFILSSVGPIMFSAQLFGWVDDAWIIRIVKKYQGKL